MTTAVEALHEAQVRGVRLWVDEGSIHYAPKDAPQDVLDALRQHKPELLALLGGQIASAPEHPSPRQNEAPRLPERAQRLVDRFVAGQEYLGVVRDELAASPTMAVGTDRERRYVEYLNLLAGMEANLRAAFGFEGCARGDLGPCDPEAVVLCEACAGLEKG